MQLCEYLLLLHRAKKSSPKGHEMLVMGLCFLQSYIFPTMLVLWCEPTTHVFWAYVGAFFLWSIVAGAVCGFVTEILT